MVDLTGYSVYQGKVYADEKLLRGYNNIDRNQVQVIKKATENFLKEIVSTTGENNYICTNEDVIKIINQVNSILRNKGYYVYIPNDLKEKVKTENNKNDPIIPDNKYSCFDFKNVSVSAGDNKCYWSDFKNVSVSAGDNKLYCNPDTYKDIVQKPPVSAFRLGDNGPKAEMISK